MADLPELTESTNRKLVLQLEVLRHQHRLTREDVAGYCRAGESVRKLATSRIPRVDSRYLRPWLDGYLKARRESGIDSSVAVAKERFVSLASEYWPIWVSNGAGHEAFSAQIELLKSQVSADLASIWKEQSDEAGAWYHQGCARAVAAQLTDIGKGWVLQAINEELLRIPATEVPGGCSDGPAKTKGDGGEPSVASVNLKAQTATGNPILDEIYAGGNNPETIRRLIEKGGDNLSPSAREAIRRARERLAGSQPVSKPLDAPAVDANEAPPTGQRAPQETIETVEVLGAIEKEAVQASDQRGKAIADLLMRVVDKRIVSIEGWAQSHGFKRTTVFDWKALRLAGQPLKGKVSDNKGAEIERAIKKDAAELGLTTLTDSENSDSSE